MSPRGLQNSESTIQYTKIGTTTYWDNIKSSNSQTSSKYEKKMRIFEINIWM
jgi:hypothetical protein